MKTRQSNLEFLRIVGILMIVMMHFTSQAGIPAVAILVFAGASLIDTLRIWLEPRYLALRPVQWLVNGVSMLY